MTNNFSSKFGAARTTASPARRQDQTCTVRASAAKVKGGKAIRGRNFRDDAASDSGLSRGWRQAVAKLAARTAAVISMLRDACVQCLRAMPSCDVARDLSAATRQTTMAELAATRCVPPSSSGGVSSHAATAAIAGSRVNTPK